MTHQCVKEKDVELYTDYEMCNYRHFNPSEGECLECFHWDSENEMAMMN